MENESEYDLQLPYIKANERLKMQKQKEKEKE